MVSYLFTVTGKTWFTVTGKTWLSSLLLLRNQRGPHRALTLLLFLPKQVWKFNSLDKSQQVSGIQILTYCRQSWKAFESPSPFSQGAPALPRKQRCLGSHGPFCWAASWIQHSVAKEHRIKWSAHRIPHTSLSSENYKQGNIHRSRKRSRVQTQEVLKQLGKIKLEFEDFDHHYPGLLPSHFHSTQISQGLGVP